jgi:hypothetical protein
MRKLLNVAVAAAVIALAWTLARRLLADPEQALPSARESASSGPTRKQLYREAVRLQVKGRSKMNKRQLHEAVEAANSGGSP